MTTFPGPQAVQPAPPAAEGAPSKQLEISNAVVRIYKRYQGKGPRSARTQLSDDLCVVVLTGCLTRAERSLLEAGNHDLLLRQRAAMQRLMAEEMVASVQSILGRQVISFMSTNDPEKELGVELFVLESDKHFPAHQQTAADGHRAA